MTHRGRFGVVLLNRVRHHRLGVMSRVSSLVPLPGRVHSLQGRAGRAQAQALAVGPTVLAVRRHGAPLELRTPGVSRTLGVATVGKALDGDDSH